MTAPCSPSPALVSPQECRIIHAYGDETRFHLHGDRTADRYTMFSDFTPAGNGTPPHFHAAEEE